MQCHLLFMFIMTLSCIFLPTGTFGVSASKGFIVAGSDGGLSNRLRALVAYMHVAKVKHDNAELVFVWDVNAACPGHFLEIFRPLDGVTFIKNASRSFFEPSAKASFPNTRAHFEYIMMEFDIPKNRFGQITWWDVQTRGYGRLHPIPTIQKKANDYIIKMNICNCSSMHLRQTDMYKTLPAKRRATFQSFDKFVSTRPEEESIFLMTDNPASQMRFIEKYGRHKILVYTEMANKIGNISVSHDPEGIVFTNYSSGNNITIPEEFRYSTLEHLLIDIIVASHSHQFKGTPFSSATDLVNIYRRSHPSLCCDGSNNELCLDGVDAKKMFSLEHPISLEQM